MKLAETSATSIEKLSDVVGAAVCVLQLQREIQAAKQAAKFAELHAVANVVTGILRREMQNPVSDRE